MHHPHDVGLLALNRLLHHRLDVDVVIAEHSGDGGEHLGAIHYHHADIVARHHIVDVLHRLLLEASAGDTSGRAVSQVAAHIDDVTHHGASGGAAARAAPIEHHVADRIALYQHGIVDIVGGGERMVFRNQCRVDAHLHPVVPNTLGDAKELDDVAKLIGVLDILAADLRDALDVDIGHIDPAGKCDGGENGDLILSVVAF